MRQDFGDTPILKTNKNKTSNPHFLEPGYQAKNNDNAKVAIIPVPYGETVSWLSGTDLGPEAILEVSKNLELFDDELLQETWRIGIETKEPVNCIGSTAQTLMRTCKATETALKKKQFPILIGGEHSISIGGIAACLRQFPNLCVIQVDAHLDLRNEYENDWLSHACVMHRLDDMAIPFFQVGIRSFSMEEWQLCKERQWQPWTMEAIRSNNNWREKLIARIGTRPVYLTFDLDAFDPSVLPATGTPEPDGFSWSSATHFLRYLAKETNIVGADFVELAPPAGPPHSVFTAAKLIYRTIGYIFPEK